MRERDWRDEMESLISARQMNLMKVGKRTGSRASEIDHVEGEGPLKPGRKGWPVRFEHAKEVSGFGQGTNDLCPNSESSPQFGSQSAAGSKEQNRRYTTPGRDQHGQRYPVHRTVPFNFTDTVRYG